VDQKGLLLFKPLHVRGGAEHKLKPAINFDQGEFDTEGSGD
jgi:hypothetical protein